MKRLAPVLLLLGLSACATPVDGPSRRGPYGGVDAGFSETRISDDRVRVSYRGRGDPGYVFDQTLVRAAGLTLEQGGDWFVIEDRFTEVAQGGGGPTVSIGGSNFSFGRRSGSSIGAGIGFQLGDFGRPRAAASLQIRTGSGQLRPDGAYDARDVLATVAPRL